MSLMNAQMRFCFFWLVMLFPVMALPTLPQSSISEEGELRQLTETFYRSFEERDLNRTTAFWHRESPHVEAWKNLFKKIIAETEKIELISLTITRVEIADSSASVYVEPGFRPAQAARNRPLVLLWRKAESRWQLWQELSVYKDLAQRLLALPSEEAARGLLANTQTLLTTELALEINTIGLERGRANPPDLPFAVRALQWGYEIAALAGDKMRAANTSNNLGAFHFRLGEYEKSIQACERALELYASLNEQSGIARALTQMGTTYLDWGNYEAAQTHLDRAMQVRETLNDLPALAQGLNEYGRLFYSKSDYAKAFDLYHRALSLREKMREAAPNDQANLVELSILKNNLGLIYAQWGDFNQALRLLQESLTLAQQTNRPAGEILGFIGAVYRQQRQLPLALEYYRKALTINESLKRPLPRISNLLNLGELAREQGNNAEALAYFQSAREIALQSGSQVWLQRTYSKLGQLLSLQQREAEASDYFQKSMTLCQQLKSSAECRETYEFLATTKLAQGAMAEAYSYAEKALSLAEVMGDFGSLWRTQTLLGEIQSALQQTEKAQASFRAAIHTIERLRASVAGNEQQLQSFFEDKVGPYQNLSELFLKQSRITEALQYAELAKSRVLLSVFQTGKFYPAKAMTQVELAQEKTLRARINTLNSDYFTGKNNSNPSVTNQASISQQLDQARLDYEDFRTKLYAAHPELRVQRGEAKPISLAEAAALLPDARTALLHYVVMPEHVRLFIVTKAKDGQPQLRVETLPLKREDLTKRVEQFRQQLAERDPRFGKLATELYAQLFKAARAHFPAQTKLVIVPDGPLWELPFQALLTEQNHYLWEEHTLAYAPSLTVLREMMRARPARSAKSAPALLAMGDPQLGGATVERAQQLMGGTYEPLPEARMQVERLQQFYDPLRRKVFTGAAATEAQWKAEAEKADVLHLAAHGVLNDRNPLYSHILLAQTDGKSLDKRANEDGLLEAWELMDMNLHAELAVLSACETARGRVGAGEGMIGLTWALFVAGVPTSVVSQWKVRADSTADLMVEFHRQLRLNKAASPDAWTKAEALRSAALKLLHTEKYRHPFHWASFVLVGKPQ